MRPMLAWVVEHFFIKQPRARRAITWLLEGDEDKDVTLCGTTLNINTIKEHGYLRASRMTKTSSLLRDELPVIINLAFLLGDGDTFVDIGANTGLYALTVARFGQISKSLRIYAYEANPDTFSRLARAAPNRVHAYQVALSSEKGTLEFVEGAVSHTFTTSENATAYSIRNQTVMVDAVRLDDCPIEGDSIVMKVDVEGQELEVLSGARAFFEAGRVKAVYVDGYKGALAEDFLKGYGFSFFDGRTLAPVSGGTFPLLAIHPAKHPGIPPRRH